MHDPRFRYFLGFRPDAFARKLLAAIAEQLGQRLRPDLLHLTLCVIEEAFERKPFLAARVEAALAGQSLGSVPIRLGKVWAGEFGPMVTTIGRQPDIQQFYRTLIALLALRDVWPIHRKSGLHPHVTLGYTPRQFGPFPVAIEWFPQELLLIESEISKSRHQVVGRWPLLPPPQGTLDFGMPSSAWRLAS